MTPDDVIQGYPPSIIGSIPGRRMRCFVRVVRGNGNIIESNGSLIPTMRLSSEKRTYRALLLEIADAGADDARWRLFDAIPLREGGYTPKMIDAIPPDANPKERQMANPSLHPCLQDLGNAINADITEACAAFDDPHIWYPGVDDGIEPVTDEQVKLVNWAMSRELFREPRGGLPGVDLADLPWNIQRAIAERRRLRFQEWGIGSEEYHRGTFSLWRVPEEADWLPMKMYGDS